MNKTFALLGLFAFVSAAPHMLGSLFGGGEQDKAIAIPAARPGADPSAPRPVKDNVVAYSTQDKAMLAAKAEGRRTMPRFEKMWADSAPGTYSVKFPLTQNGATEHIWLQVDGFQDDMIVGRLANEPVNGAKYRRGQDMSVAKSDVEDWMVRDGNAIWGAYSARVALADMPKAKADKMRVMFKD
jgi:uncharacterized protein YegJ (DUF2314 family)